MGNFIIGLCNGGIKDICFFGSWLLNFLPNSPFSYLANSPISSYLPVINWIVPVQSIVDSLTIWVTAIGTYYLYSIFMRWIKAIN